MPLAPAFAPALALDIVSDTICPWCYVGKRRLEAALPGLAAEGLTFDITWRPFQLNPDMPDGGVDRRSYRTQNSARGSAAWRWMRRSPKRGRASAWASVMT